MSKRFSTVPLKELLIRSEAQVEIEPEQHYKQVTVRLWGKGVILRGETAGTNIEASKQFLVEANQFILSKIDARNGALGLIPVSLDGAIVSSDFPVFSLNVSRIIPKFLNWMSKTNNFVSICKAASEGTTNRIRLREDRFLATEIPLPSLEEQQRIVEQVEELVAKIEKARGLHQVALDATKALSAATANALFNLTRVNNWPVVELGDIADIHAGVTLGRALNGPTIRLPYLRVANVQDGFLDLSNIKETDILPTEFEKWQLKSGDILLTEGGDWDKLGRGAVWHAEIPDCIHQNHIFCVRTNPGDFNPNFLLAVIGSPYGKAYFQKASKQTTNLASINQKQLKAFKVFQPPLSEQDRIMAYLNNLQAKVSMLKVVQTRTSTTLDAMLPSILDKAFRGEL